MSNFKPVIGWDDNISNHTQNHAPTSYAVSKMRAGRTPRDVDGNTITDVNKIFRPGLYFLEAGALHTTNVDNEVSTYNAYLYMLVQDPDESLNGGHALDTNDDSTNWHLNVGLNVRQILYSSSTTTNSVTTRIGSRDTAIASLTRSMYKVVPTVQQIQSYLAVGSVSTSYAYAYVKDIGMWIRYTIQNSNGLVAVWEPAINWEQWKAIMGYDPVELLTSDITAKVNTHYVSFGQHTVTLPIANICEIGATVQVDQWSCNGKVRVYNNAGSEILHEKILTPCIKNVGLSDCKIHDDPSILPNGTLFTKSANMYWKCVYNNQDYILEKVQLKAEAGSSEGPMRYALYHVVSGNKIMYRVCKTDVTYPFDATVIYNKTADTVFSASKTYYTKTTVEGADVYTEAVVTPGAYIEGDYYEASTNAEWFKVDGKQPSEVALSELVTSMSAFTRFTVNDVDGNIEGGAHYVFEVTFDKDAPNSKKMWVLVDNSDFEAFMNRVEETLGERVANLEDTTEDIGAVSESNATELAAMKRKYYQKDKSIRITTEVAIYGDNAKVSGEELITYDDSKYLDPSELGTESYIVNWFLARYTPVYTIAKYTGDAHIFYLPTKAASMIGKKVRFILEPGSKIKVYDDCSSATPTLYEFNGTSDSVATVPHLTVVEFELAVYKNSSDVDTYAWVFTKNTTNVNTTLNDIETIVLNILTAKNLI